MAIIANDPRGKSGLLQLVDKPAVAIPTPDPDNGPAPKVDGNKVAALGDSGVVTGIKSIDPRVVVIPADAHWPGPVGEIELAANLTFTSDTPTRLSINQTDKTNVHMAVSSGNGPFANFNTTTNQWSGDSNVGSNIYIQLQTTGYTLPTPINMNDGLESNFIYQQDIAGNHTVVFPSNMQFPMGVTPGVSLGSGEKTWVKCIFHDILGVYICEEPEKYEGPPTVSISADQTLNDPNGTITPVTFIVTLSKPWVVPLFVDYHTADGSAHAGAEYTAATGTLTFSPGITTQTITVNVSGTPD